MTRTLLAIILLPLAFVVGCGDPTECESEDCTGNTDCVGADCGDDEDTGPGPDEFSATLRSVAPYGWVGDHRIEMIEPEEEDLPPICTDTNECDRELTSVGNYRVNLQGDTWDCVPQVQLVDVNDLDLTVAVSDAWLGEGACGLAPEGEDGGWEVYTDVADQVWIHIDNDGAVVTGDTFFYEDDEYLLEGTITLLEESFQVYFHRVVETGETERTLNIPLED
mgnify:FL=1